MGLGQSDMISFYLFAQATKCFSFLFQFIFFKKKIHFFSHFIIFHLLLCISFFSILFSCWSPLLVTMTSALPATRKAEC